MLYVREIWYTYKIIVIAKVYISVTNNKSINECVTCYRVGLNWLGGF